MLAQLDLDSIESTAGVSSPANPAELISIVIPYVFGAAGTVLLIMLITAGYQMIFSRGDPKAMQIAQSRITSALVGILVLFFSFWIVKLIGQFLGISVFDNLFGGISGSSGSTPLFNNVIGTSGRTP